MKEKFEFSSKFPKDVSTKKRFWKKWLFKILLSIMFIIIYMLYKYMLR